MGGIVESVLSPITSILGGGKSKAAPPIPAPELPGGVTAEKTRAGQARRRGTAVTGGQTILTQAPDEGLGG